MAATGQGSTHAPQSMHSSGLMYRIRSSAPPSMMQSTGHTSTQDLSFKSTQVSVMMYAIGLSIGVAFPRAGRPPPQLGQLVLHELRERKSVRGGVLLGKVAQIFVDLYQESLLCHAVTNRLPGAHAEARVGADGKRWLPGSVNTLVAERRPGQKLVYRRPRKVSWGTRIAAVLMLGLAGVGFGGFLLVILPKQSADLGTTAAAQVVAAQQSTGQVGRSVTTLWGGITPTGSVLLSPDKVTAGLAA